MGVTAPFWFTMRQGKAEEAGTDILRLTAPNLKDAFISIRQGDSRRWSAALKQTAEGPEVATSGLEFPERTEAWEAAFELYRTNMVV